MPQVEVLIRIRNNDGSGLAYSTFSIGEPITSVLLNEVAPIELVQDFGEMFVFSIHEQFPTIRSDAIPGDLHVTSREGTPIRRQAGGHGPITPETLTTVRREIEGYRPLRSTTIIPDIQVDLSGIDFAELETRLLALGHLPVVSMETAAHNDIEELYQNPEPPQGESPASRRIRQALRAGVGEEQGLERNQTGFVSNINFWDNANQTLLDLYGAGCVSRQTLLEAFGLTETSTRQELEEALSRLSPNPEPQEGRHLGAILDDAAYVPPTPGTYAPQIIGDSHLARDLRGRHQARIESFQAIYGGDSYRSSGVEPPFQPGPHPRVKIEGPKPPENRTAIPTRYQRKSVI
jgi:hypothetical protein